jgi:hypothetical protein
MGTIMITTSGYNPTGNSSVERFHRYLNSSLSIIFDKVRANWDEYLPAVLFSYRSSINATTGFSPFYLEHGREPQLPLGNLFPYLQKKETRPENFVADIQEKLDFAFKRAQERQATAAEQNKARRPEQYKPTFKVGDFLLVMARAAEEGRLIDKDEEGKFIKLPEKLKNQYIGPYKMIGWAGERYCKLDVAGVEKTYNVNRLIKHYVWDEDHLCTDKIPKKPLETPLEPLKTGDLFIFPMEYNDEHRCVFGMGKVLEIKGRNNIFFQWYGNAPLAEASKPFTPAWVTKGENKGYYSFRKLHPSNPPWTNEDTATCVGIDEVILKGTDLVNETGRISAANREKIETAIGEKITWGR